METRKELADYLGISIKAFTSILYSKPRKAYYFPKTIKKSNGMDRQIYIVSEPLKFLQRQVASKLSTNYTPSNFTYGFVQGKSIIKNAKYHQNKKYVIKLDLQDFFPSITFARVRGMFMQYPFKFGKEAATTLAQICCLDDENGSIPQGAPSSPYIANMICRKMDVQLARLAKKYKLHFTRYADDLTFSTNDNLPIETFLYEADFIIKASGFKLNNDKTRIMRRHQRQAVTGIIVNEGLNVNRKFLRNLRATLHNCEKRNVYSQVVRNKFKDERNSRCKIWDVAGQWVDQYGDPIDVGPAKKRFLRFLRGKIAFYGQVVFAGLQEKDLDNIDRLEKISDDQTRRIQQYAKLLESWIRIAKIDQGPDFVEKDTKRVEKLYRIFRSKEDLVALLKNKNLDKLQELANDRAKKDPRFFLLRLSGDEQKDRRSIAGLLSELCPSSKKTRAILSEFKVPGEFLHDLTHQDYKTTRYQYIENVKKLNNRLDLPDNLKKLIIDDFLNKLIYELDHDNKEVNIWEKAPEIIKEIKKKIRLSNNTAEECTNFDLFIDEIIHDCRKKYPKYDGEIKKDIIIRSTLYTDVENLKKTLKSILTSMIKNTSSSEIRISKQNVENDEKHYHIIIHDYNIEELGTEPTRDFANGKIRDAMKFFLGLGDYFIIANFKGHGWKKINMYDAEDITSLEKPACGFSHYLRLPIV